MENNEVEKSKLLIDELGSIISRLYMETGLPVSSMTVEVTKQEINCGFVFKISEIRIAYS